MIELPIDACEICKKQLLYNNEEQTLDVSECVKCHNLACPDCIDYRSDLGKWLCRDCYIILKSEKS
jgi:hypothetical protein